MKYLKFTLLLLLLLSAAILANSYLIDNFGSDIRFIADRSELDIYYQRGLWLPLGKVPYTETFIEYPQLAACFLALPHGISMFLYGGISGIDYYTLIFSLIVATLLFLSIIILYYLKGEKKYYSFLMLLPASLYFTYNRYDILPVFLSILSIALFSKERYKSSSFILALGVLSKWYLILLLPIFLRFYYMKHKRIHRGMLYVFSVTGFLGILPTLLSGGVDALMVPYKFQAARGLNKESLFYLLKSVLGSDLWFVIFFLLQFAAVPLCLLSRIDSIKKVISWSCFSILVFMLFAKFYSPQWILWILPFLILRARNIKDVFMIVLFDIVTYFYFPVIYDGYQPLLIPIIIVKTIILLYFTFAVFRELFIDIDIRSSLLTSILGLRRQPKIR